jgi:hypothetical protein
MATIKDKIFNIVFVLGVIGILVAIIWLGQKETATVHDLRAQNDSLLRLNSKYYANITEKTELITAEKLKTEFFKEKSELLARTSDSLKSEISSIQAHRETISAVVDSTPTGDIYSILGTVLYPDSSRKKPYCFSEKQIRGIYLTKLDHDTLEVLVSLLDLRIANCETQLANKDSIIIGQERIISTQDTIISDYEFIVENDSIIMSNKDKEISATRKKLRYWQLGAVGAGIIAVLAIL